jgi:signal peptidase I
MTPAETPRKSVWREYAEAIGVALILALTIRTFIVQAFKIPSGSMIPTLLIGDHLLVNKFIYRFRPPSRGEIVVFKFPQDRKTDFIKRVVAVEGNTVEVTNRTLYIDGRPVQEPFAFWEDPRSLETHFGPVTVPAGKVFVMGDNRDNSYDSRFWGPVDRTDIVGEAMVIYWSWGGSLLDVTRWKRIGTLVR